MLLVADGPAPNGRWRGRLRAICLAAQLWLPLLLLPGQSGAAAQPADIPLAGRRVSEVLDQLRNEGLSFVYNTQIVADTLVVTTEPRARNGVELAKEILAPYGLGLSQVTPRLFAVVKQPESSRSASANSAAASSATAQNAPQRAVEEVVVQTSRYALASAETGSHAFLDQEQVKNLPRLGDETLSVIGRLPGAAANGLSSVGPIRGGTPNETAILLDGLRLYEPFHLKNYFSPISLLDSRLIAGIDIYSGGFPANYGDRMSAIIDARSVRPALPRYYELGLSLFHASALASGAFAQDRAHALVSARRSNLGELAQLSENDFGKPEYSDGFARFDYDFNGQTRGSLSALLSHDRITAKKASGTQRADEESSNSYTWATLEHDWTPRVNSRLIASLTQVSDERAGQVNDPGRRIGQVSDQRSFSVVGLRIDNEVSSQNLLQRFGIDVRRLWAEYDYSSDVRVEPDFPFVGSPAIEKIRTADLHPDGFETAAYWDGRLELNRLWTVHGGLRFDTQTYDGSDDSAQWSPRLSVLYNASGNTHLRASWGRFFQAQGINELQVEDGIDRFYPAQQAQHTIVSIEHAFAGGVDLRIEAYRKQYKRVNPRFENLLDPLVLLPEVEFDRVMIDADSARADGVEVLFNWHPQTVRAQSEFSGWFSYTLSRVQDRIDGVDVDRSWDQRHAVSLGIAWTHGPWAATLAGVYHTGWPTTQLELVPAAAPGGDVVVIGPRNAARYEDYGSLDFRLTRTFTLRRGLLDVFVETSNMLSRENPCCTEYTVTQGANGADVLERSVDNWLPLVPSFGVLWRYGKE